jgi:hypothetical protein
LAVELIGAEHPDQETISRSQVIGEVGLGNELRQVAATTGQGAESHQRYPQDADIRIHARAPPQSF